jgi:hypothetical protein
MDRSHDAWLWVAGASLVVGVAFLSISAALVAAKPPTLHAHWTTTWEAYVAYCLFVVGCLCFVAGVTERRFPLIGRSQPPTAVPPSPAASSPSLFVTPQTEATEDSRQPIFDEAPPELAGMTKASLKELLAGRTEAQVKTLMKQHVGKPVRASGKVDDVSLASSYRGHVRLRGESGFLLLLFFDLDDEDPGGQLLVAINPGERLVVSGVIHEIQTNLVALDNCKVIDVS